MIFESIVFLYFIVFFISLFLLLYWWLTNPKDTYKRNLESYPFISILVAARNEENNILNCLTAITKLNYPTDKYEVLVGNDNSEDTTEQLIDLFIKDKNNFYKINIMENIGLAKGKANVLAHLAHKAKGEYFFITDADIQIPEYWVQSQFSNYTKGIGTVSGVTIVKGERLFDKLQSLDWVFAFGMIKLISDKNMPVSAVGNNMSISRECYNSVGGYENIPFSITEDFELFRQVIRKEWNYKNLLNVDVLAYTKGIESFDKLILQRKRWMHGAMQLPPVLIALLTLQALFFPFILVLLFLYPFYGIMAWALKIVLQNSFNALVLKRMNLNFELLKYIFIYEIYSGILATTTLVYYWIPGKIVWKGRKY